MSPDVVAICHLGGKLSLAENLWWSSINYFVDYKILLTKFLIYAVCAKALSDLLPHFWIHCRFPPISSLCSEQDSFLYFKNALSWDIVFLFCKSPGGGSNKQWDILKSYKQKVKEQEG